MAWGKEEKIKAMVSILNIRAKDLHEDNKNLTKQIMDFDKQSISSENREKMDHESKIERLKLENYKK